MSIISEHKTQLTHSVEWSGLKGVATATPLPQYSMLEALRQVEKDLPTLLMSPDQWRTLDITYHPPRVERVFTQHGDLRIFLHCIHPCSKKEALFHPHPWPSSMRILSGEYEMAVGYGAGEQNPPIATTVVMSAGSSYEMVDPDAWHYVRSIERPAMTLMVTSIPWNRSTPKSLEPLQELTKTRRDEIMEVFRNYYSR